MPLLSRHDIRTWVGLPNARYRESQRAYGALKLMHEPYNSKVAWDWVACELFRVLLGRDGGYVIDAKHNALWHMRGEHPIPENVLANIASEWMITYKEQWFSVHEHRRGKWVTRVKADVREPTQRQLLVDIVRPMNYSPIPSRRTVKEAKRRLKTENVPGAGSVVQHEREKALCVTKARPTRPPPPLWGSEANRPIAVPELTALLPSRHQNLQSDLHSTLLRENDADVRVETLEHEVSKENLGHGGDKEHLEALSWNVVVGDSGCLDGGETANEKGRLEDLDRG